MIALLDVDGPAAPPRSNGELVFGAPWESRSFGLAMALHDAGTFEWEDFRQHLIAAVAAWDGTEEWSYYRCWVTALERVLAQSGVVADADIVARAQALAARPDGHDHGDHEHGGHDHGEHGHGEHGHGEHGHDHG